MSDEIRVTVCKWAEGRPLMLRWTDPVSGKRKTKTSGTTSQRKAERLAGELERELRAGSTLIPCRITWQEFRERWQECRGPELSDSTIRCTGTAFNHVERVLSPDKLAKLTTRAVTTFVCALRADGMKDTSIGTHLRHLRAALSWAHRQGLLAVMPRIDRPKSGRGKRFMRGRPVSAEEFERMLDAVPKVRADDAPTWIRYLRGLWLSGLRRGESIRLSWDRAAGFAVDLTGRHPRFRIRAEAQKAGRDELLPMTPEFARRLLETPEGERRGRVFRLDNPATGRPLDEGDVGKTVAAIGERAGIIVNRARKKVKVKQPDGSVRKEWRENVPEFAGCHTMRRSFGSRWAKVLMPAVLKRLMRHASVDTTMRYYVDLDADELADQLWDRFGAEEAPVGNTSGNIRPADEILGEEQTPQTLTK